MYERTPRDQAHPSRVPLELISSGCFYELPFSKYYSTHTHISDMASPRLQCNATQVWGSLGISSPWGTRVDAGGTSSAAVINAVFSAVLSYSQTRGDGGISEG